MNIRRLLVPLLILFALITLFSSPIIFALLRKDNSDSRNDLETIASIDLKTLSGTASDLNSYSGKIVVINTWSTWCTFCVDELPQFVKLQKEYRDDIVVIAVNRAEPLEANKTFFSVTKIAEEDLIFLIDSDDSFYSEINGIGMPETIFIDKSGSIVEHIRGPMDYEKMKSIVEKLLQENT